MSSSVYKNTQFSSIVKRSSFIYINKTSTEAFLDVSIAEWFDSVIDKYIAKECKITRRKGQKIEILSISKKHF